MLRRARGAAVQRLGDPVSRHSGTHRRSDDADAREKDSPEHLRDTNQHLTTSLSPALVAATLPGPKMKKPHEDVSSQGPLERASTVTRVPSLDALLVQVMFLSSVTGGLLLLTTRRRRRSCSACGLRG